MYYGNVLYIYFLWTDVLLSSSECNLCLDIELLAMSQHIFGIPILNVETDGLELCLSLQLYDHLI